MAAGSPFLVLSPSPPSSTICNWALTWQNSFLWLQIVQSKTESENPFKFRILLVMGPPLNLTRKSAIFVCLSFSSLLIIKKGCYRHRELVFDIKLLQNHKIKQDYKKYRYEHSMELKHIDPLLPDGSICYRIFKISISKTKGNMEKFSYERRSYKSVDDRCLFKAISQNFTRKMFEAVMGWYFQIEI